MDVELHDLYGKLIRHSLRLKKKDPFWNSVYLEIRFEDFVRYRNEGMFIDEDDMISFFERLSNLKLFK